MSDDPIFKGINPADPEPMGCPRCRPDFVPFRISEDGALCCHRGHVLSSEELLASQSPEFQRSLEALLTGWEQLLDDMSGALARGEKPPTDDLLCPNCSLEMLPVQTRNHLFLECDAGHVYTWEELLRSPSEAVKRGLQAMLSRWEMALREISLNAIDAGLRGYFSIAEVFLHQVTHLRLRIDRFRCALDEAFPSDPKPGLEGPSAA